MQVKIIDMDMLNTTGVLELIKHNNNFNEILVAGTTFTGTVLAIFFTLIALPVQNILSKYSQDLIRRVVKDLVFLGSFIFLILTFTFDLILIAFGSTPELAIVSLGLSVASALVLLLLVIHTFYLLDVRNQLNDITNRIKKQIPGRMQKSENKRKIDFIRFKKFLNLK
jgi:uncharacterized membrane protein (DUF485 family)